MFFRPERSELLSYFIYLGAFFKHIAKSKNARAFFFNAKRKYLFMLKKNAEDTFKIWPHTNSKKANSTI